MTLHASRRAFIAGAAALPFLRVPAARAAPARHAPLRPVLLSAEPAALGQHRHGGGTVKLLICIAACSPTTQGRARAASWRKAGAPRATAAWIVPAAPNAVFHNGDKVTRRGREVEPRADRGRALHRLSARPRFQGIARIETPDARTLRVVMKNRRRRCRTGWRATTCRWSRRAPSAATNRSAPDPSCCKGRSAALRSTSRPSTTTTSPGCRS